MARRSIRTALTVLTLLLAAVGCGSDDEPASTERAATTETAQSEPEGQPEPGKDKTSTPAGNQPSPPASVDSGIAGPAEIGDRYDPTAGDGKIRGDGSIQRFGDDADDDEAQAAIAVAVGFYDARAAGDWDRACDLLSNGIKEQLEQTFAQGQADASGCPTVLAALAGGLPRAIRAKQAKTIRFTGFRVDGDNGYALFVSDVVPHGFVPMHREDGDWKVAALSGSSL